MSAKACTLAAVRESLTPEQWARLERINPHLAAPVARARQRGELVEAHAQRNGRRVDLVAKGLRLDLTPNARLHPQQVARRRRREHQVVTTALRGIVPPAGPWRVVIVRVGPRVLDDDNRTASAKGVRDAVATWLGVDDGSGAVRWEVRGEVARGYAVRISVEGCE